MSEVILVPMGIWIIRMGRGGGTYPEVFRYDTPGILQRIIMVLYLPEGNSY